MRLEYDYDLISGKVNRVSYQRGARDAWHHWYEYDADNRITQVYTSTHPDPIAMAGTTITDPTVVSALWEQDSKYFYYAHGPLMRQELGSNQVQGVDYAYTLQGWIKGINSNALDATKDMGHDGSGTGLNGRFARDVASFSLSYYEGDFSSVASTGAFSSVVGSDLEAQSAELYNGNIRIMQTTLMENNGSGALTASNLGMAYKYDQLNRLKQAKGFTQYTASTNAWAASSGASGEHNNFFTFDANGNIVTQQRYEGSTLVDNLTYQYATNSSSQLLSNRLYSVDDAVTVASLSDTDMEDMPLYNNTTPNTSNNYKYTQIGELKSDAQEEIQEIVWRVDSKISEIVRTSGSAKKNLKFEYDAMGNRVAKHVYAGSVLESSTYYVRDAQGNVMGVYEHKMDAENAVLEYRLIERNIYGSAQVGICKDTVDLNITNASGALTQATYYHARQLNHRQYSLSNHLGNVLTTLGDGKAATDSNSDGVIDYYKAHIISVSDYSPFGVELASRTWSIEEYRNGFNGQEKIDEISGSGNHYTAMFWEMDPRLGRRWNLDSKPQISISDYAIFRNNPVWFTDVLGDSSVWDNKGYMVHYDPNDKDLRVFIKDGDKLNLMGSLGGDIDASKWLPNLLKENSEEADDIFNPFTFRNYVKQYGKWDYKYASPANPNSGTNQHILGIAFYRKDKTNGLGDLPETYFNFNGSRGRAEDLNNLHFGVVGDAAALFPETFMLKQAGTTEMDKWADKGKEVPVSWRPIITIKPTAMPATWYQEMGAPYGDNPVDHEWIKKGFQYYNNNRSSLDGDWW